MTLSEDKTIRAASSGKRQRLLNIRVDDLTMAQLLKRPDCGVVFTLNLDHLYQVQRNRTFYEAYQKADVVTADSKYVYWMLRLLGRPVREKVSGSDMVPALAEHHANDPAVRIFLLGAKDQVAEAARQRINTRVGHQVVVGAHGPSMRFIDDPREIESVVAMVNRSGASVLMVGLGAPKQEVWIAQHRHLMPQVRMFLGIGATIDYEAGAVSRAPPWMRRSGLEWFYRVVTEPRRYAMRYLKDTIVIWYVFLDALGWYRNPFPE